MTSASKYRSEGGPSMAVKYPCSGEAKVNRFDLGAVVKNRLLFYGCAYRLKVYTSVPMTNIKLPLIGWLSTKRIKVLVASALSCQMVPPLLV